MSLPMLLRLNRHMLWNSFCAGGGAAFATGALVGVGRGLGEGGEGLASCGGGFGGLACTFGICARLGGEAVLGDDGSGGGGGDGDGVAEGGDAEVCRGDAGGGFLKAVMSKSGGVASDSACDGCDSTAATAAAAAGGSGWHRWVR